MAAVVGVRRRWERDDARLRSFWRELLWGVPVVAAILVGALFMPRTWSAWLDGLVWTACGALLMTLLVLGSRRRGAPPLGFAIRLAFLNTVIFSVQRLLPEGSLVPGLRALLFTGIVTPIVLLAHYAASRWKRRAAPGAP